MTNENIIAVENTFDLKQFINFLQTTLKYDRNRICYLLNIHYTTYTMIENDKVKTVKLNGLLRCFEILKKENRLTDLQQIVKYLFGWNINNF